MTPQLAQLVRDGRLAAVKPRAWAVLCVWLVDHPTRRRPNAKRVQLLAGMSRATYFRAAADLAPLLDSVSEERPQHASRIAAAPIQRA